MNLNPLRLTLIRANEITEELRRLDLMEADARKKIEAATDGDLSSDGAQRAIADARVSVDLAGARRRKLKGPRSEVSKALDAQFAGFKSEWNSAVLAAKQAKTEELFTALLPFFEGDERAVRRKLDGFFLNEVPCFAKYRSAGYSPSFDPNARDHSNECQLLIAHIERQSKICGIPLE